MLAFEHFPVIFLLYISVLPSSLDRHVLYLITMFVSFVNYTTLVFFFIYPMLILVASFDLYLAGIFYAVFSGVDESSTDGVQAKSIFF